MRLLYPLSQIYDGAASWNWWVQSAKKGTFFRDTRTDDDDLKAGDEYGFKFVQSFVAGRKDIQEIIGVCQVQRVKSKVIFFGYCTPIALFSNGKKWAFADWYINANNGAFKHRIDSYPNRYGLEWLLNM